MGSAVSSMSKVAVWTGFGSGHSGFLTPSQSIAPGTFWSTKAKSSAPMRGTAACTASGPRSERALVPSWAAIFSSQIEGG